jgi:uncharacterized RDD family membrane protein YckC
MSQRLVSDKPLRVAPEVLGQPLAAPWRRFVAFGVDYLVLILPTVVLAATVSFLAIWVRDPRAFAALKTVVLEEKVTPARRGDAMRVLLGFLQEHRAIKLTAELQEALRSGDQSHADEVLAHTNLSMTFNISHREEVEVPGLRKETAAPPAGETGFNGTLFKTQVRQSAAGSSERQGTASAEIYLEMLVPGPLRAVCLYGLGALYFALLGGGRRGATIGKRMLGIRVVRLDGHRLNFIEGLERFVGYLHIPGSLFLNLLDLWRDPNRRLPHDRVVHTAVVRVVKPVPVAKAAIDEAETTAEAAAVEGAGLA